VKLAKVAKPFLRRERPRGLDTDPIELIFFVDVKPGMQKMTGIDAKRKKVVDADAIVGDPFPTNPRFFSVTCTMLD